MNHRTKRTMRGILPWAAALCLLALPVASEVPWPWNAEMGASGECLKSAGAGLPPVWGTCGAGGAHASTHQDGGDDEVSVNSLSGRLADPQYVNLLDEGANTATRTILNFTGAGVSVADDAGNGRANITIAGGGAGLPSGAIILMLAACPSGFTEVSALAGKFVLGTTNAAGDVTGTGGSDTVTAVLNHTHTVDVTDPGHVHEQTAPTSASSGAIRFGSDTNASGADTAGNNATQSATTGVTATTANPAGGVASIDNRPAFVKVIFCEAD